MPASSARRSPAFIATAVALPVALVVGLLAFLALRDRVASPSGSPTASGSATGVVAMPAPHLAAGDAQACLAFVAALPVRVRDVTQRRVSAGAEQNAAYGDPPITIACGVPPVTVPAGAEIFPLSGVCWYAAVGPAVTIWTTLDRRVPVAVTLPNSYTGQGQWVTEFRDALVAAIPSAPTRYNC